MLGTVFDVGIVSSTFVKDVDDASLVAITSAFTVGTCASARKVAFLFFVSVFLLPLDDTSKSLDDSLRGSSRFVIFEFFGGVSDLFEDGDFLLAVPPFVLV